MKDDIEEPISDPRSLAEAIYDESLGDDAGSLLCELLHLHAIRTCLLYTSPSPRD